jgi:Raf kinase inhibitor-like YbhB/YbcL family protein
MRFLRSLPILIVSLALGLTVAGTKAQAPQGGAPANPPRPPFTLTVAGGAQDGADFPLKNSAAGDMTSPLLSWINTPPGTVTFLVHMHDMDNARNKTMEDQLHWMVWNIPGSATSLPEGVPKGNDLSNGASQTSATGVGTYRPPGFAGNGPKHHYVIELFALDTKIDATNNATDPFVTRADVLKAAQGHILGKAMYLGLFRRPPAPASN